METDRTNIVVRPIAVFAAEGTSRIHASSCADVPRDWNRFGASDVYEIGTTLLQVAQTEYGDTASDHTTSGTTEWKDECWSQFNSSVEWLPCTKGCIGEAPTSVDSTDDTSAIDQIAALLGNSDWSPDTATAVADIVGKVRPHPGDEYDSYADKFLKATGRKLPSTTN